MSSTGLYLDKSTINAFYIEIYGITLDCLMKFACPVVFDTVKRKNIKIRMVCNKQCPKIDMVLRYLKLELNSLRTVSGINFEYSVDFTDLPIARYSLDEIENATKFLAHVKQHNIKDYKKPTYN